MHTMSKVIWYVIKGRQVRYRVKMELIKQGHFKYTCKTNVDTDPRIMDPYLI